MRWARNRAKAFTRRLFRNESGNFAIVTAFAAVPIMIGVAAAVDINHTRTKSIAIATALDSASLASVIPADLTDTQREEYARQMFDKNYFGDIDVELDIDVTRESVTMHASAQMPTLMSGMIGIKTIGVAEHSTAVLTRSDIVCVLALDPSGAAAIEFAENARFAAPACSVQANSSNGSAMISTVSVAPSAKTFCVAGISLGSYSPYVKHKCTPVADPYKDLQIPKAASSCTYASAVTVSGTNTAPKSEGDLAIASTGESLVGSNTTLKPGIYCRGLKIEGANVTFLPGVYHVWGNLEFTQYTSAQGDGVTFILKGENNRLIIKDGAQVTLRAPSTGLTAGLVFWQKHLKFWDYVRGRTTRAPNGVTATSEISSGGGLNIIGTAYFPNHQLIITSSSPVVSQSPATSFIAYRIKFAGRSNTQIHVDHEAGGIPPIQPRSDEGARLTR